MDYSVQVNIPAESGDMGILAQHVPTIEQLKPGLVEVFEENGGSKLFFCTFDMGQEAQRSMQWAMLTREFLQCPAALRLSSPTPFSASMLSRATHLRISTRTPWPTRSLRHKRLPAVAVASRTSPRRRLSLR